MAVMVVFVVAVLSALVLTRRQRLGLQRDDAGASLVIEVLLVLGIILAMVWVARETLFDTQNKANDQIQTEVGEVGR